LDNDADPGGNDGNEFPVDGRGVLHQIKHD
jgi:hypothetical protein